MKQFVKLSGQLIRTSLINRVWYEHESQSYLRNAGRLDTSDKDFICIELTGEHKIHILYDNAKEIMHDRNELEAVLLEAEPLPEPKRPADYDKVLTFCRAVWNYYGQSRGSDLTAQKLRKAIYAIDDLDYSGYGIPKIYNEVAVKYGILSKPTPQRYTLNVE